MLVSKEYQEGDIVSFKIVNGDELVARIVGVDGDNYTISKPCTIMPGPQGIGMIQSLFTANQDVTVKLNKQHVILHAPSIDQIQSHYIKTTTGIEPITRGGIIT